MSTVHTACSVMTKKSAALKKAEEEAGIQGAEGDEKIRFKSIRCGLKSILRHEQMQSVFVDHSSRIGKFRHLVTLVANEELARTPSLRIVDWLTFYQHLWAAVESKVGVAYRRGPEQIKMRRTDASGAEVERTTEAQRREIAFEMVDAFFTRHPLTDDAKKKMLSTSPVIMRQQECVALETATKLHIELFPKRVRRYVRARLTQMLVQIRGDTSLASDLTPALTDCILCGEEEEMAKNATLTSAIQKKVKDAALLQEVTSAVMPFVNAERQSLGDLVGKMTTYKGKRYPPWVGVMSRKSTCFQLLPHLHRLSTLQLQMLRDEGLDKGRDDDEDEEEEEEEDEEGVGAAAAAESLRCSECSTDASAASVNRTWTRRNRPQPFAMLPMSKLQNAMVYYGCTEVKALYGQLIKEEKEKEKEREKEEKKKEKERLRLAAQERRAAVKKSGGKRRREQDGEREEDERGETTEGKKDEKGGAECDGRETVDPEAKGENAEEKGDALPAWTSSLVVSDDCDFAATLFDLSKRNSKSRNTNHGRRSIRGVLRRTGPSQWRLVCFRTNGVQCSLTFATGLIDSAPGVAGLFEKGYSGVTQPDEPFDVSSPGARGVYRLTQTRCDIRPLDSSKTCNVLLTAVDPGQKRPVQTATVPASCAPNAATIAENAAYSHITSEAWMRESGRLAAQSHETERRKMHTAYGTALDSISKCRRRCADAELLSDYSDAMLKTLVTRCCELLTHHRSHQRWKRTRSLQKHLSRVADSMFGRSSHRPERREPTLRSTLLGTDERECLLARLRLLRREKRQCTTHRVVFFGDGTFGHLRGNASVPKKTLVRELGVRGPTVLIDEYCTSKYCPCGHELCDSKAAHPQAQGDLTTPPIREAGRVRVHKTIGDDSCEVLAHRNDRDELAATNMLLTALRVLKGSTWPAHLTRSTSGA